MKYVAEEKLRGNLLALAFNLIAHHWLVVGTAKNQSLPKSFDNLLNITVLKVIRQ